MKRMWLRWVLMGLFVVALGFTFVSLGQWQLDRLDQRRDRNANVVTHEQAPVVTFEDAFSHVITEPSWRGSDCSDTTNGLLRSTIPPRVVPPARPLHSRGRHPTFRRAQQ